MLLERQFVVSVSGMQCRSNPVPDEVGAQVDPTMIIGAHGHREINIKLICH
jgi:hypothetical protein